MQLFNSGLFWFVEGVLFVIAVLGFRAWALDRGVRLTPTRWILVLLWAGLAGFSISFVGTSLGEGEPTAAARGGLLFGLVTIVSGVGLWRFLISGASLAGSTAAEPQGEG